MDTAEQKALKEQLQAMIAGRGDGIDLDSQDCWVVQGLKNPVAFFRHLSVLIGEDSILYFEGCDLDPEVAQFYEKNRASNAVCVTRDTIFPIPEIFHVAMTPAVIDGVTELLSRHPVEVCFAHVKAYREERLMFTFHDAFDGSALLITDHIPEERIRAFSSALGALYRREPTEKKRDPEQLRRFLWALENPDKLRINWPWWKKALLFWKR